ncbi:FadR/GntR family transcriptional regulator [Streptomyces sp. PU-14G]|uniref:FadR/GntR family transcriptional regulator n=1 Tax=Streptomyces sp. PU-14G TaxID=2800808 RepID=UPI0034DFE0D6
MTRKPASTSGRRPRDVVADALRARIRNGEYAPGSRLPTQRELETEFTVGRSAVREALAALTREGLLQNVGRGSSPTVAEPDHHAEAPRSAGVELTDRLHEAFQAEHVTVDAFSLTTETLNNALAWPIRQVMEGRLTPRTVTARVLVPSLDARLALPRRGGGGGGGGGGSPASSTTPTTPSHASGCTRCRPATCTPSTTR